MTVTLEEMLKKLPPKRRAEINRRAQLLTEEERERGKQRLLETNAHLRRSGSSIKYTSMVDCVNYLV